jgi:hypothetical protein
LQLLLVLACLLLSKVRLKVFPHPDGHGGRVLGRLLATFWLLREAVSFLGALDVVVAGGD